MSRRVNPPLSAREGRKPAHEPDQALRIPAAEFIVLFAREHRFDVNAGRRFWCAGPRDPMRVNATG